MKTISYLGKPGKSTIYRKNHQSRVVCFVAKAYRSRRGYFAIGDYFGFAVKAQMFNYSM